MPNDTSSEQQTQNLDPGSESHAALTRAETHSTRPAVSTAWVHLNGPQVLAPTLSPQLAPLLCPTAEITEPQNAWTPALSEPLLLTPYILPPRALLDPGASATPPLPSPLPVCSYSPPIHSTLSSWSNQNGLSQLQTVLSLFKNLPTLQQQLLAEQNPHQGSGADPACQRSSLSHAWPCEASSFRIPALSSPLGLSTCCSLPLHPFPLLYDQDPGHDTGALERWQVGRGASGNSSAFSPPIPTPPLWNLLQGLQLSASVSQLSV